MKCIVLFFIEGKYCKFFCKLILDNIDFMVVMGEKVGIIGFNGLGKFILFKVICGILEFFVGSLWVRGEIVLLIELGVGFDLDLCVWDNIIFYGVMLGFFC